MSEKKTPAIRFQGFTDDWEDHKLGKMVNFSKGRGYSKSDIKASGTPIILYGRLYTKYETVISNIDTFADEKTNSVFSDGGEVIVPASGETAEDISVASVVGQSGVLLGGDLNIITPSSELDSTFLAISISNGKPHRDMAKMAQGKSVVHLHNSDLAKIDLPYPNYEEQCKISQHFKTIDTLITLHQRKLTKLQLLKKSMLSKMFPKDGARVPEIRFQGFHGNWEHRKISEMFKITRGYVLPTKYTIDIQDDINKYPVFSSQTANNGLMGYYKDYLYENAITWTTDGANAGTVRYRRGKFYCTNVCGVLLSDNITASKMIAEALNQVAKKYVSYVGNPKLMNNVMADIVISLPQDKEEQDVISKYFEMIDYLILLQQRKLSKLQQIKQAMLSKLFV